MVRFLIRRVLLGVFVMFVVTIVVFLIFFVGPAPPMWPGRLAGRQANAETVAEVSHRLLLNKPLPPSTGTSSTACCTATSATPTTTASRSPPCSKRRSRSPCPSPSGPRCSGWSSACCRRPLGGHSRSIWDRIVTVLALFFYSMPSFVLGLLLLYFFYYSSPCTGFTFPRGRVHVPDGQPVEMVRGTGAAVDHPCLMSAAAYTRLTRGSMLDVMSEDYIRTARAKGCPRAGWSSAMRSALP